MIHILMNELTSYQVYGLKKLASYRKKFYGSQLAPISNHGTLAATDMLIKEFIEIFCEHNFADSDYSIIQDEPMRFDTVEEWIQQASVSAILKSLTYFIWTDNIVDGYFKERLESRILEKLLLRLETAIKEEYIAA